MCYASIPIEVYVFIIGCSKVCGNPGSVTKQIEAGVLTIRTEETPADIIAQPRTGGNGYYATI